MTQGSALKLLIGFSLPLFLGNLFQQVYSMVDTIVVGRFVGVEALAALGAIGGFSFMVVGFAQGLGCGFAVLVSQCYGANDYDRMRKCYAMSIVASIVVGVIISALFFIFSMPLLELVRTPENIITMANDYISIIYIGLLASIFYNLFSSILRAVGDSRSPLLFLVISSVLNVVLDLFFVLVIPLACAGVAIATILSQAISAAVSYVYIVRKFPIFKFRKNDFKLDFHIIRMLLKIGIPGAVQFSVCALGVIIVQIAINDFGSNIIAAYSIGTKIETIMSQMFTALGMAISTYAGQNLGAGRHDRALKVSRYGMISSVIISEIIAAMLFVSAPWLMSLFSSDPDVINAGSMQARIEAFFYCLVAVSHSAAGILRGAGKPAVPMAVMLGAWCVFRVIFVNIAVSIYHSALVIYITYPVTWLLSTVIFAVYLTRSNWLHAMDKDRI